MKDVSVGLIQLQVSRVKEENYRSIVRLASSIEADIVALPEYSMFDPTGMSAQEVLRGAEGLDGPWVVDLRRLARERGSCLVGTFFERGPGKAYNSVVLIDDRGDVVGVYRKTHLFDALGYRESMVFEQGGSLFEPVELCGVRVGVAVCFELRFPEVFRYQALRGAEVFIVPSAWYRGPGKEEQYRFLAQARAHENTVWLAAPILYGDNFTGRSLVVDPYGVVRAEAGFGEKTLVARLRGEELEAARRALPLLEIHRRARERGLY